MAGGTVDGVSQLLDANRLLATLCEGDKALVAAASEPLELVEGEVLLRPGQRVSRVIFPHGTTTVSMTVRLHDGRSIEVCSIGREGAVGGIVSCGDAPAFTHCVAIVPGPAVAVPIEVIEDIKSNSVHVSNLFCRYSDFLLAQLMQGSACNAFHPIEARAARWLLTAQDRAGPRLRLTQDALARLLGVQRTTINAVVGTLGEEGLLATRRGMVEIVDRPGLEARACECYAIIERFFDNVIPHKDDC